MNKVVKYLIAGAATLGGGIGAGVGALGACNSLEVSQKNNQIVDYQLKTVKANYCQSLKQSTGYYGGGSDGTTHVHQVSN